MLYRKTDTLPQVTWVDLFRDNLLENMDLSSGHDQVHPKVHSDKCKVSAANWDGRNHWKNNRKTDGNHNEKSDGNGGGSGSKGRKSSNGGNKHKYYDDTGKLMGHYIKGVDLKPIFTQGIVHPNITRLSNKVKQHLLITHSMGWIKIHHQEVWKRRQ